MNPDNIQTQMRRGALELCTLALLAKGDAYTSDIVNALRDAEMIVVEGLYTQSSPASKTRVTSPTAGKNRPKGHPANTMS